MTREKRATIRQGGRPNEALGGRRLQEENAGRCPFPTLVNKSFCCQLFCWNLLHLPGPDGV